jgi:hypothetical protein
MYPPAASLELSQLVLQMLVRRHPDGLYPPEMF